MVAAVASAVEYRSEGYFHSNNLRVLANFLNPLTILI
jgi:hypothetical protein